MDHRQRSRSWLTSGLLIVSLLLGLFAAGAPSAVADDDPSCAICQGGVTPPRANNDYEHKRVLTQGALWPHTSSDSKLGQASTANAGCTDCTWSLSPVCMNNGPGDDFMCMNAAEACPQPGIFYTVYLKHGTGPWETVDTICLGPGEGPVPAADVAAKVRDVVVTYLPDAAPSFQPAQGGLVNLPTLFAAGEPESVTTEPFQVLGFTVVVTATAHWDWTFDRGVEQGFDKPGGAYPNDDVSWTYASAGERDVSLTTTWDATFTIDGGGPYTVPAPAITKTVGPIPVPVREARSALVGG
jgi:hypothetical protein